MGPLQTVLEKRLELIKKLIETEGTSEESLQSSTVLLQINQDTFQAVVQDPECATNSPLAFLALQTAADIINTSNSPNNPIAALNPLYNDFFKVAQTACSATVSIGNSLTTLTENSFQLPSPGELYVLGKFWEYPDQALRLSHVHRLICQEIDKHAKGEPADLPAITTISTHLRSLLAKGLIRLEVSATGKPLARSPKTSYRAAVSRAEVMQTILRSFLPFYGDPRKLLIDAAIIASSIPTQEKTV